VRALLAARDIDPNLPEHVFQLCHSKKEGNKCNACSDFYCTGCNIIQDSDAPVHWGTTQSPYIGVQLLRSPNLYEDLMATVPHEKAAGLKNRGDRREQLETCLAAFNRPEVLVGDNKWYCPKCKDFREATKTLGLWAAPDSLVVHLKRFSSVGAFREKINTPLDYPLEDLDLAPYILGPGFPSGEALYDLAAVACHHGGLGGGHYFAYARNAPTGRWFELNDSSTHELRREDVVTEAAYVLMYTVRFRFRGLSLFVTNTAFFYNFFFSAGRLPSTTSKRLFAEPSPRPLQPRPVLY
jgi:uncharacterized UBP type Zn finger protein